MNIFLMLIESTLLSKMGQKLSLDKAAMHAKVEAEMQQLNDALMQLWTTYHDLTEQINYGSALYDQREYDLLTLIAANLKCPSEERAFQIQTENKALKQLSTGLKEISAKRAICKEEIARYEAIRYS